MKEGSVLLDEKPSSSRVDEIKGASALGSKEVMVLCEADLGRRTIS